MRPLKQVSIVVLGRVLISGLVIVVLLELPGGLLVGRLLRLAMLDFHPAIVLRGLPRLRGRTPVVLGFNHIPCRRLPVLKAVHIHSPERCTLALGCLALALVAKLLQLLQFCHHLDLGREGGLEVMASGGLEGDV